MRITDFHKIPYQIGGMVVFSGNAESPRGTKYHFWTLGDELRVTRWGIEKGVKVGRGSRRRRHCGPPCGPRCERRNANDATFGVGLARRRTAPAATH
jgi:hypothetical protein